MDDITINKYDEISKLISNGIDSWVKAGLLIIELIEEDIDAIKNISKETGISESILYKLEDMGRYKLYPRLMLKKGKGIKKLSKCNYSDQKKYCYCPVDVLIKNGDSFDILKIEIENLTNDQIKQVFNNGEIRNISSQRAYLESLNTFKHIYQSESIQQAEIDFFVEGKKLVVLNRSTFSRNQLIKIIESM